VFAAWMMDDHVHTLVKPWQKENHEKGNMIFWPLKELLQSIKSIAAHEINQLEEKNGSVWKKEQFDRYVRSDRDLKEKFHYILRKPWDSGAAKQNADDTWILTP